MYLFNLLITPRVHEILFAIFWEQDFQLTFYLQSVLEKLNWVVIFRNNLWVVVENHVFGVPFKDNLLNASQN